MSDGKTIYYLVHGWRKASWTSAFDLYKSTDSGESYSLVLSLHSNGYNNNSVVDMWKPEGSDSIFIIDNVDNKLYLLLHDFDTEEATIHQTNSFSTLASGNVLLTGKVTDDDYTLYALINKKSVYTSTNGTDWTYQANININAADQTVFRELWYVNPINEDLYAGGFQFYTSKDEGQSWTQHYANWWNYYDTGINIAQRKHYMHVDMMDMGFFTKSDGTPFIVILNHAGVYVSYDNMLTTNNLGLENLNITTLYDYATADDGTIYFGAQDKGTMANFSDNNIHQNIVASENQTTGDGMRELFFNNDQSWFGFLQNGLLMCKADKSQSSFKTWNVPGTNTPGWINPIAKHPDPTAKACYIAGGDIDGGSGSHLIHMEVSWFGNGSSFTWNPTQYDYDFSTNSHAGNSVIKALSAAVADHDRLYVATKDASFFYSEDHGSSWARSSYILPTTLIPSDIVVSETDADMVLICGTGWSNTGVYISYDGGESFEALDQNIIEATFYNMVLSPYDKVLFAATSEGPYAYVFEDAQWYSLASDVTPVLDYMSVEYLSSIKTVRFGTYGRGVWDYTLQDAITSTDDNGQAIAAQVKMYPNPIRGNEELTISLPVHAEATMKVFTNEGSLVYEEVFTQEHRFNVNKLVPGIYHVVLSVNGQQIQKKLHVK